MKHKALLITAGIATFLGVGYVVYKSQQRKVDVYMADLINRTVGYTIFGSKFTYKVGQLATGVQSGNYSMEISEANAGNGKVKLIFTLKHKGTIESIYTYPTPL